MEQSDTATKQATEFHTPFPAICDKSVDHDSACLVTINPLIVSFGYSIDVLQQCEQVESLFALLLINRRKDHN